MRTRRHIYLALLIGVAISGCDAHPDTNETPTALPDTVSSHQASEPAPPANPETTSNTSGDAQEEQSDVNSYIELHGQRVRLELADHPIVNEFANYGTFTLVVNDFGGKEKVGDLPFTPQARENLTPPTVHKGDIYLYGSRSLVVFYHTEANQWSGYTYIGRLDEPDVLDSIIGTGQTEITLDIRK
ncbi:hypothetical protein I6E29_09235 [Arcanobacterium haemolyticum]|nr:hypothetical protein [Arcanobacterium haemolyticum]